MGERRLEPRAWVAIGLQALYHAAEALCSIFVGVYFWINSLDFNAVGLHYLALYAVIPGVFLLAGWYSQARDRLHVYRAGLVLHAVYYGVLLGLRERSPEYAVHLGALLGVAWGVFYAGSNTFNFDVTAKGKREYYFGLLQSVIGLARLLSPLVGGIVIGLTPDRLAGYHAVFAVVIGMYLACFALSFWIPSDNVRRPFRIKRALVPGPDQRDWRLVMLASATLAGAFSIFTFLLGLMMFMLTDDEVTVGSFASFQGMVGVVTAFVLGRVIVPRNRRTFLFWGMLILVSAGLLVSMKLTVWTLVGFGFLRAVAGPFFAISHFSLRLDIISESMEDPGQRIEYLAAWEVPLAFGRVVMMSLLMGFYHWAPDPNQGLQWALLLLCCTRIATFAILSRTSMIRRYATS